METGPISALIGGVSGAIAALMLHAAHPHATMSSGPGTLFIIGVVAAVIGLVTGYFVAKHHENVGPKALWVVAAIAIFGILLMNGNDGFTTNRSGLEAVALIIAAFGLTAPALLGLVACLVHRRKAREVLGSLRPAPITPVPGGARLYPGPGTWALKVGRPGPTGVQN